MAKGRPRQGPHLIERGAKGWFIQWFDEERGEPRRRATGTRDRGEADKVFARWRIDSASIGNPAGSGPRYPAEITIAEVLNLYAQEHGPEIKNPDRIGYAIKALLSWWKDRRVDAVLPVSCTQYRNFRVKHGVTIATAGRELSTLRAALFWAEHNARLVKAPFVKVPPPQPGKDRWLTRNEAARLLWAARKEPKSRLHLPLFILLALHTGARSEAILTLKWFPQIDLERGRIDYNPPGRERTQKHRPLIPLPRRLQWFLTKAKARTSSPHVLNYHGAPIQRIKHSFAKACARAGLADVTPHTLRHTCGTWLAQQGVDLFLIAGWLGHTQQRTTELYAHHHPDHMAAARKVLD